MNLIFQRSYISNLQLVVQACLIAASLVFPARGQYVVKLPVLKDSECDQKTIAALEPGQTRTEALTGGQYHCYPIKLEKGQYLKVIVEQTGGDIGVDFYDVERKQAAEAYWHPKGSQPEVFDTVVEQSGVHVLLVMSKEADKASQYNYAIQLVEVHPSSAREQALAKAEKQQRATHILRAAGQYAQALALIKEAMATRKEHLGTESVAYAESVNQAGLLYNELSDYVKAEAANSEFVSTFEELLREVWIGIENVTNFSGAEPTDDAKIADLAEKLHDMLISRRQGGNLSREEFVFVSMHGLVSRTSLCSLLHREPPCSQHLNARDGYCRKVSRTTMARTRSRILSNTD